MSVIAKATAASAVLAGPEALKPPDFCQNRHIDIPILRNSTHALQRKAGNEIKDL